MDKQPVVQAVKPLFPTRSTDPTTHAAYMQRPHLVPVDGRKLRSQLIKEDKLLPVGEPTPNHWVELLYSPESNRRYDDGAEEFPPSYRLGEARPTLRLDRFAREESKRLQAMPYAPWQAMPRDGRYGSLCDPRTLDGAPSYDGEPQARQRGDKRD